MIQDKRIYDCFLLEIRTDTFISQQQVADAIGVSRQTINNIEKHIHEPTISTALKLARYFNMPVEMLFELNEQSRNESSIDSSIDQHTAAAYVERWAQEEAR